MMHQNSCELLQAEIGKGKPYRSDRAIEDPENRAGTLAGANDLIAAVEQYWKDLRDGTKTINIPAREVDEIKRMTGLGANFLRLKVGKGKAGMHKVANI